MSRSASSRGVWGILVVLALLGVASLGQPPVALAHGDTVRVAYGSVKPERLVVKVGTTVHFHNANASGAPCTVVLDDGSATSPALGRAVGWHHTFEKAGEFVFHLSEYPSRTGTIVVVGP